jgi:hypothetical protein
MASDYGLNFGFLRSDESVRLAEGRFRVPAAVSWLLGTAVEPDTASTNNELKVCSADAAPVTGYAGLLLQELEWLRSIYQSDADSMDSFMYGVAKPANLAIVTNGAGTKVWFKNTPSSTRADGRAIPARTMFTSTSVARGVDLGWDGTKWVFVDGTTITKPWMRVTNYSASAARVEAVLLA